MVSRTNRDGYEPFEITDAMVAAGAAVVCEWFPFDGERPAISQAEAKALVGAILAALSGPASAS